MTAGIVFEIAGRIAGIESRIDAKIVVTGPRTAAEIARMDDLVTMDVLTEMADPETVPVNSQTKQSRHGYQPGRLFYA